MVLVSVDFSIKTNSISAKWETEIETDFGTKIVSHRQAFKILPDWSLEDCNREDLINYMSSINAGVNENAVQSGS